MGNVIPWSQIHPSITSEEPFVAVVIIDPQRQICVSEMVAFEPEALASADIAAAELIAAAQAAATRVASGYRTRRKEAGTPLTLPERLKRSPGTDVSNAHAALKRHSRGATPRAPLAWADGPGKRGRKKQGEEIRSGLRVLNGGKS
jgi:hypothetical protein